MESADFRYIRSNTLVNLLVSCGINTRLFEKLGRPNHRTRTGRHNHVNGISDVCKQDYTPPLLVSKFFRGSLLVLNLPCTKMIAFLYICQTGEWSARSMEEA